jgi:hypothetical protein
MPGSLKTCSEICSTGDFGLLKLSEAIDSGMAYIIGILLALVSVVLARLAGLDRDRAFYPTVLVVYVVAAGFLGWLLYARKLHKTGPQPSAAQTKAPGN